MVSFLSCLFGSELVQMLIWLFDVFLSCLFGSEHHLCGRRRSGVFLSCLFGSELFSLPFLKFAVFLSCLFGSEPMINPKKISHNNVLRKNPCFTLYFLRCHNLLFLLHF